MSKNDMLAVLMMLNITDPTVLGKKKTRMRQWLRNYYANFLDNHIMRLNNMLHGSLEQHFTRELLENFNSDTDEDDNDDDDDNGDDNEVGQQPFAAAQPLASAQPLAAAQPEMSHGEILVALAAARHTRTLINFEEALQNGEVSDFETGEMLHRGRGRPHAVHLDTSFEAAVPRKQPDTPSETTEDNDNEPTAKKKVGKAKKNTQNEPRTLPPAASSSSSSTLLQHINIITMDDYVIDNDDNFDVFNHPQLEPIAKKKTSSKKDKLKKDEK